MDVFPLPNATPALRDSERLAKALTCKPAASGWRDFFRYVTNDIKMIISAERKKPVTTSKRDASKAAKLLHSKNKEVRSVAGSDLAQAKRGKKRGSRKSGRR
jgi:hypothetical protein